MHAGDPVKLTKVLLLTATVVAGASIAVQAQSDIGISLDLARWTPATILAVLSVVFSFGISYQTLRVHGRILRDFEKWRDEYVNPTLGEHAVEIAKLQVASTKGRNHGR